MNYTFYWAIRQPKSPVGVPYFCQ